MRDIPEETTSEVTIFGENCRSIMSVYFVFLQISSLAFGGLIYCAPAAD